MAESQAKVEGWYREYGAVLLRYLGRRFGRLGADDLLQETFVQALRRSQGETVSPRAWLFGIARHVGITAFRRRKVMVDLPESAAAPMLPVDRRPTLGRDDQSSDTVVDVITEEQLLRGMESLTPTEPSANGGSSGGGSH